MCRPSGRFAEVRLLSHDEPLFKSEKGTAALSQFARQYRGLTLDQTIHVLGPRAERTQTEISGGLKKGAGRAKCPDAGRHRITDGRRSRS